MYCTPLSNHWLILGTRPRGFWNRTTKLQDTNVSNHISELPLLLDLKPEDLLPHLILDTEIRGEIKRNFISDVVVSIKQPLPNFPATPMSLNESKKIRHMPSRESWTDSGYTTYVSRPRSGNSDCIGTYQPCNQLASPLSNKSQCDFFAWSPPSGDTGNGYIEPALLSTSGSTGILQSIERMDQLFDWQFPPKSCVGAPILDDCGAWGPGSHHIPTEKKGAAAGFTAQ